MKTLTESQDLAEGAAVPEPGEEPGGEGVTDRAGQRLGHFRIVSMLGRGGMGVVYLAEDLHAPPPRRAQGAPRGGRGGPGAA